jgi:hypothetical protein
MSGEGRSPAALPRQNSTQESVAPSLPPRVSIHEGAYPSSTTRCRVD